MQDVDLPSTETQNQTDEVSSWQDMVAEMASRAWRQGDSTGYHRLASLIERVTRMDSRLGLALEDVAHDLIYSALDFGAQVGYSAAHSGPSQPEPAEARVIQMAPFLEVRRSR